MRKEIGNDMFFAEVERLLDRGESVTMLMRGDSMRPLLRSGVDRVTIRRHEPHEIVKGALLLFRHKGAYVMHRVRAVEKNGIVLAGDGNYRTSEHAIREDIVAIAISVTRPDGRTLYFSGRRWRIASAAWLMLPPSVRHCILGFSKRIKNNRHGFQNWTRL